MSLIRHSAETCPCCILKRAEFAIKHSNIEDYEAFTICGDSLYKMKDLNHAYLEKIESLQYIIDMMSKEIKYLNEKLAEVESGDPE